MKFCELTTDEGLECISIDPLLMVKVIRHMNETLRTPPLRRPMSRCHSTLFLTCITTIAVATVVGIQCSQLQSNKKNSTSKLLQILR
jgi:hypothetical protein